MEPCTSPSGSLTDFVRRFSGSQLIDASINSSRHRTRDELRHFRYLIYLEGNDMGAGLWWSFGSGSVVFMPESLTSESLLSKPKVWAGWSGHDPGVNTTN